MVAKVCQALAYTQSCERIDEARALSCPELCERIVYGGYSFIVPDSCVGVSFTVAMALSCQVAVRAYRRVATASSCQIAVRAYRWQ